jgi:hypothetical protein
MWASGLSETSGTVIIRSDDFHFLVSRVLNNLDINAKDVGADIDAY